MFSDSRRLEQLQKTYESVVSMLEDEQTKSRQLEEESVALAMKLKRETARVDAVEAENGELKERLAQSDNELARLEQEARETSSRYEAAVAEAADAADAGRLKVAEELARAERKFASELAAVERACAAREQAMARAISDLEVDLRAATAHGSVAAQQAAQRVQAADREKEEYRDQMRKSVGSERQRVASMLYKEALQKQTLEDQERQLEELNVELADTRQSLSEAEAALRAANQRLEEHAPKEQETARQMAALAQAQAKNTSYIEELDEQLAVEQAAREEQASLVAQLQTALTERTSKEAASASAAAEAERALAALKQEARALRLAVKSIAAKRVVGSTQTEENVAGPEMASQTDWAAVHMPLPCLPHGGSLPKSEKAPWPTARSR